MTAKGTLVVFKRRDKPSLAERAQSLVYPRGGWTRAAGYVWHRLRRLPDPPHRIARGIACGVFVSFSPLFGFHFIYAVLCALLIRGNVLAAMLATFVGNPITFPFMAATSLKVGEWLFGMESAVPLPQLFTAFAQATGQLWENLARLLLGGATEPAHWDRLAVFFEGVFLPYLVGSPLPGLVAGIAAYLLSYQVIAAYQRRRARALAKRLAARLAAKGSAG